jgi:hypothetical protein
LNNSNHAAPDPSGLALVISALESQLVELDRMNFHIGAAHVDAAIQHLRLEQARIGALR